MPRDAAERRRFRAFVRAHHPDAGGDPEAFVRGLAELRRPRVPDRYDSPVVVVPDARTPAGVLRRLRAWYRRKRRTRVR